MSKYYNEELKPVYLDALVKAINFDLPEVVLEQEIAYSVNSKIRNMSEAELEELRNDKSKIDAMREEAKPTAEAPKEEAKEAAPAAAAEPAKTQ